MSKTTPTPTPAPKVVCKSNDCGKEYVSKGGMMEHYKKKHNSVGSIQSPLGRFPSTTNPARVLFDEHVQADDNEQAEEPRTQGNSKGQVNSPKVMSNATYQCNDCNNEYLTKNELDIHRNDNHESAHGEADPPALEEVDDHELRQVGEETEQEIAQELERAAMKALVADKCHECKLGKEVNSHQEKTIREKESKIQSMARRIKKTDEKKNELHKEKNKMGVDNKHLKSELKKCQEMLAQSRKKVSTLTAQLNTSASISEVVETLNSDDEDLKIKCDTCGWEARNSAIMEAHMNIKHNKEAASVEHICNACNKKFTGNDELEVHMTVEHEDEADCSKCNAFFKKEADVYKHAGECDEIIPLNTCDKCEREVISKAALKKHMLTCKGKKQVPNCKNGSSCRWHKANRCLFVHQDRPNQQQANQHVDNEWHVVQPRQRQAHIKCHNCKKQFRNQSDKQNHFCDNHQRQAPNNCNNCKKQFRNWGEKQNHLCDNHHISRQQHQRPLVECRWGAGCHRLKTGMCPLKHNQQTNRFPQQSQPSRPQLWCQFQDRCLKGQRCAFKHFQQGFLPRNPGMNQN